MPLIHIFGSTFNFQAILFNEAHLGAHIVVEINQAWQLLYQLEMQKYAWLVNITDEHLTSIEFITFIIFEVTHLGTNYSTYKTIADKHN